ncbi:MAG: hypothetical protein LC797_01375 [Chloroflexi bacterium]|nr:hypothetical protein [Chloroflexota bacterium]
MANVYSTSKPVAAYFAWSAMDRLVPTAAFLAGGVVLAPVPPPVKEGSQRALGRAPDRDRSPAASQEATRKATSVTIDLRGRQLQGGKYELQDTIAQGMATVYAAHMRSLDTTVAVKIFAPRFAESESSPSFIIRTSSRCMTSTKTTASCTWPCAT